MLSFALIAGIYLLAGAFFGFIRAVAVNCIPGAIPILIAMWAVAWPVLLVSGDGADRG